MPKNKKPTQLTAKEQLWEEIDQQTQAKIYQIFTTTIPFQNIKLITEPWHYEDRQQKLTGLFLDRDVDYRTLVSDFAEHLTDLTLPELKLRLKTNHPEPLPEQIAYEYLLLVIKSLVGELREFGCHDESYLNF